MEIFKGRPSTCPFSKKSVTKPSAITSALSDRDACCRCFFNILINIITPCCLCRRVLTFESIFF